MSSDSQDGAPASHDDRGEMMSKDTPAVLVVDDEDSVAEGYSLWLSNDYDVRTATSGEEAVEQLDEELDAALLDRRMPGMSGDDVLSEIRERDLDCRVAMVTAVDPDFDIVDMEFDAYLTKPVDREALRETVEQLLSLSSYDDRVQEQFRLAEKKANLEMRKPQEELEESPEYQELQSRLDELESQTEELVDEMDHETFSKSIRKFT